MYKNYAVTTQKRFMPAKAKSLTLEEDKKQCSASVIISISRS